MVGSSEGDEVTGDGISMANAIGRIAPRSTARALRGLLGCAKLWPPDLPRLLRGGRWLATPGKFFPGFGRHITDDELVGAAVEEARASSGWCKIIGDWLSGVPVVPANVLADAVAAVHAIGGRVAVHTQTAASGRNAVLAGADSIEHAAGVTVLAGTDSEPCGEVVGEVEWLVKAGIPAEDAIGAASWTARAWLGLPGIVAGAPADIVVYPSDPRNDLEVLRSPLRTVLRGREW